MKLSLRKLTITTLLFSSSIFFTLDAASAKWPPEQDEDDADVQKALALSMEKDGETKESQEAQAVLQQVQEAIESADKDEVASLLKQYNHYYNLLTIKFTSGYYKGYTLQDVANEMVKRTTSIKNLLVSITNEEKQTEQKIATTTTTQVNPWQNIVTELKNPTGYGTRLTADKNDWDAMKTAIFSGTLKTVQTLKGKFTQTSPSRGGKTLLQWAVEAVALHPTDVQKEEEEETTDISAGPVLFYESTAPWYEFANLFEPIKLTLYGQTWRSSEHCFQAQKFTGQLQNDFIKASAQVRAREVFNMVRDAKQPWGQLKNVRADWNDVKDQKMYEIVKAKFEQNPALKKILLSTGNQQIVEHTTNDNYWADGGDGGTGRSGQNKLGKILMRVRRELGGQ